MEAKASRAWSRNNIARNLLGTKIDPPPTQLLSQHLGEFFIRTDGPVIIDVVAAKEACDVSFFWNTSTLEDDPVLCSRSVIVDGQVAGKGFVLLYFGSFV